MIVCDYITRFLLTFCVLMRKPFLTFLHTWLLTLCVSCGITEPHQDTDFINLKMELSDSLFINSNDEYEYIYPRHKTNDYTRVLAETNRRNGRVFWTSQDSFEYSFQGMIFKECVINYSTYCIEESDGLYTSQQLVYLNPTMIGDTIEIVGYYTENIFGTTRFIVR